MSVRVYQLAKQLGIDSNEVVKLLRTRGISIEGASSSIPTIYANALVAEIGMRELQPQIVTPKAEVSQIVDNKIQEPSKGIKPKELTQNVKAIKEVLIKKNKTVENSIVKQEIKIDKTFKHKTLVDKAQTASQNDKPSIEEKSNVKKEQLKPKNFEAKNDKNAFSHNQKLKEKPNGQKDFAVNINIPQSIEFSKFNRKIEHQIIKTEELKVIDVKQPIVVKELAMAIGIKPFQLIAKLMSMDVFASMNKSLEPAIAQAVAEKFGFKLEIRHRGEKEVKQKTQIERKKQQIEVSLGENLEERAPIVCVLGHVDHGKTTLLDTIRKTHVVSGEAGGITQRVAAYQIEYNSKNITFIDTPGHAAFSKMRERGANLTDIGILVVAADDGFMPQTDEALKFAKNANISIIVAINKIDSKGANIDKVKQQMQQRNIASEDWGGDTLCCPISALKGENINNLLDLILLQAEIMELKANTTGAVKGVILESQIDVGLGSTTSAIIQNGTLKIGDHLVCGNAVCKVRALIDDNGKKLKIARPSTPVKITGWESSPNVGDNFRSVESEKIARIDAEEYKLIHKNDNTNENDSKKIHNLNDLFAAIESANKKKYLKIIIKADVKGSLEALRGCLEEIKSTKITLEIVGDSIGLISKNDVVSADSAGATIVAFNTKFDTDVQALAKHHGVRIINNNIIYETIDAVRDAMADLLEPELKENKLGAAEIRQIFAVKHDAICGCMVVEGKILRDKFVRVIRNKEVIFQGKFESLKRIKDDTNEVRAGFECGIKISGFEKCQVGDFIECFEIIKIKPSL